MWADALGQRVIRRALPIGWTTYTEPTCVVSHKPPIGSPSGDRHVWTSCGQRHGGLPDSRPGIFGYSTKPLPGGVRSSISGNRILCFSLPKIIPTQNVCFLVLPHLPSHNPMELVATAYVGPTIQLPLRQRFTFLSKTLCMQNKVGRKPRRGGIL
jgi:hypothetical protein